MAYDKGKQQDPAWKPLFDGYLPVAQWLADRKADVLSRSERAEQEAVA